MAFSKIILNGTTLMDVTQDTVEESTLLSGETATAADGVQITGTLEVPTPVYQAKTVTPTEQQQVVTADNGTVRIGTVANSDSVKDATTATWTVPITYSTTPAIGDTIVIDAKISVYTGSQSDSIYNVSHTFEWAGSNHSYVTEPSDWSITVTSDTLSFRYKTVPATINRWTLTILNYTDSTQNGYISKQANYDALSSVTVTAIPSQYIVPSGNVTLSSNGTGIDIAQYATATVNVSGGSGVTVEPLSVTANGTYTAPTGTAYSPVTVNVSGGDTPEPTPEPPTDGKTHIWIHIDEDTPANRLEFTLRFGQTVANGVQVDWGDNSAIETISDTTLVDHNHTYAAGGDYEIILDAVSGTITLPSSSGISIAGTTSTMTFYRRTRIRRVAIGNGITTIGAYAFSYCYALTSVYLPYGVTSIGTNAFWNCYCLQSITIPDSVTSIGNYAFNSCYSLTSITIPEGVTTTGTYTFQYCYRLRSITLPDSLTTIGDYAFYCCRSISSINIPDGVTAIGNYVFYWCYSLQSVAIPDTVGSIGNYAFQNCAKLTSIEIPNGATSIGSYAFNGCESLSSIVIPDSVTSIGSYAFNNCKNLKSIAIPEGVTTIPSEAFDGCAAMSEVTIPNGVTSIGTYAFRSCYNLRSITMLPNSVTTINANSFNGCSAAFAITIPAAVTSIGNQAFYNCYGAGRLRFEPTTPPTVANANAFTNVPTDCVISVPVGTLAAYTSAANYPSASTYTYIEE